MLLRETVIKKFVRPRDEVLPVGRVRMSRRVHARQVGRLASRRSRQASFRMIVLRHAKVFCAEKAEEMAIVSSLALKTTMAGAGSCPRPIVGEHARFIKLGYSQT